MPDLLADRPDAFIRMSEAYGCALRIAHGLIGTPQANDRNYYSIPMRKGTALEPMCVEWMADHGFSMWFTGDSQLEIRAQDPLRSGHPDGFISILPGTEVSWWAQRNVPQVALDMMYRGDLMLAEVKTMNPDSFSLFRKEAFSDKDNLFRKYKNQIQLYMNTLANRSNEELWQSSEWQALLRAYDYTPPSHTLIIAFCPATNDYSFAVYQIEPEPFELNSERLHREVIIPLREEGVLPEPTYDGTHADCFWCPYADLCPAVEQRKAERQASSILDSIPLGLGLGEDDINQMATQYKDIQYQIKILSAQAKDIKDTLESALVPDVAFSTGRYRIKFTTVKGRRTMDTVALKQIADSLGFEIPYKEGAGYVRPYITPIYGDDAERGVENE